MILYMVVPDDEERYPSHNAHGRATYSTFRNAKKQYEEILEWQKIAKEHNPAYEGKKHIIIKVDTMDAVVVNPDSDE